MGHGHCRRGQQYFRRQIILSSYFDFPMTSFLADIPKLVQELGFEPLPAEKRTEYLLSLEEIISSRVNVAVLERLSEEGHSLFISLIEQGRDEDALTYVR